MTKPPSASSAQGRPATDQLNMRAGSGGTLRWTAVRDFDWNQSPGQKSAPQKLAAGRRYYFEVLHDEASSDDLALSWLQPGEPAVALPKVITATNFCPFIENPSVGHPGRNSPIKQ